MSILDIVLLLVVVCVAALVLRKTLRDIRRGKLCSFCEGSCSGCCCSCEAKNGAEGSNRNDPAPRGDSGGADIQNSRKRT